MMIFALLSIGAINALIPIIVIVILIAAAAGASNRFKLFEIFGVAALLGIGIGKGTLQRKSPFKSKRFNTGKNPFGKLTTQAMKPLTSKVAAKLGNQVNKQAWVNYLSQAPTPGPQSAGKGVVSAPILGQVQGNGNQKGRVKMAINKPKAFIGSKIGKTLAPLQIKNKEVFEKANKNLSSKTEFTRTQQGKAFQERLKAKLNPLIEKHNELNEQINKVSNTISPTISESEQGKQLDKQASNFVSQGKELETQITQDSRSFAQKLNVYNNFKAAMKTQEFVNRVQILGKLETQGSESAKSPFTLQEQRRQMDYLLKQINENPKLQDAMLNNPENRNKIIQALSGAKIMNAQDYYHHSEDLKERDKTEEKRLKEFEKEEEKRRKNEKDEKEKAQKKEDQNKLDQAQFAYLELSDKAQKALQNTQIEMEKAQNDKDSTPAKIQGLQQRLSEHAQNIKEYAEKIDRLGKILGPQSTLSKEERKWIRRGKKPPKE